MTRMKIVLIGAGRLATCLGRALLQADHEVTGVLSRSDSSASALGSLLHTSWYTRVGDMPQDADLYILSVTDDAVPAVAASLPSLPQALVVHTAGSLSLDVFKGTSVEHGGIFYPMQTFSKEAVPDFSSIPCFIETVLPDDLKRLECFAGTLSRRVFPLSSEKRRFLHLAAVFASNFSNHCYAVAERLLSENGIPFDVMLPLIDQTACKVHSVSPLAGQTGPAARNDTTVMKAQEKLLESHPEWQEIYRLMSRDIQKGQ